MELQILFKNQISIEQIEEFISRVYQVHRESISELQDNAKVSIDVYYSLTELQVGYKYVLELFFDQKYLEKGMPNTDLLLAKCFVGLFNQKVLVSTDSVNPYEWLLVAKEDTEIVFETTNDVEGVIINED